MKLNAYHEGGHVIISIEDDGAGINREQVLAKAIEKGLVTEANAASLSDSQVFSYIFNAGFSTAKTVSSVSGRGVGMDVVKTAIERIGGTVDLSSTWGVGTTVRIKIPLTLAIISALVVESSGESFAIPQLGVVELVRLAAEDRHKIERIHEHEVFRLRDRLLPLVYLNDVLGIEQPEGEAEQDVNIVVVQVGEDQFGLIVTEVFDTEEIVVKPVGRMLKDIGMYQGTTILGDGRVIMILDVTGIAAQFGGTAAGLSDTDGKKEDKSASDGTTSMLLFETGEDTTMSVPLSLIARLEDIPRENIELSGDKMVVQYRGDLLPLVPINNKISTDTGPNPQPVIVFSEGTRSMGLMVNQIKDIIEEPLVIRMQSQRAGVLGTAIIDGKATDVIDTQHYIFQALPDWFTRTEHRNSRRVLVVDDSIFFRQLITTTLEAEGYKVVVADNAVDAVELIEHGESFEALVSDIDMPMMDGFDFAEWVRARPEGAEVPIIGLSSLSAATNEAKALQADFDKYLVKFTAQELISSLEELCTKAELRTGVSA